MTFFYVHLGFFAAGTNTIDTVRKLPLFVTVLGSDSAATANVYKVSEPRVESYLICVFDISVKKYHFLTESCF